MDNSYTLKQIEQKDSAFYASAMRREPQRNNLFSGSFLARAHTIVPINRYANNPVFYCPERKIIYMKQILSNLTIISHRINGHLRKTQSMYCQIQNANKKKSDSHSASRSHQKRGDSVNFAHSFAVAQKSLEVYPKTEVKRDGHGKRANRSFVDASNISEYTSPKKNLLIRRMRMLTSNRKLFTRRKALLLNYLSKHD
jgi:hypothetical protein